MKVRIDEADLKAAAEAQIISEGQSKALWERFSAQRGKSSHAMTVLAYFGALVVISSMTWFATRAFSEANPWLLFVTGLVYFAVFTVAAHFVLHRLDQRLPAAVLATIAVFMTPLTVFALQKILGITSLETPGNYHDYYVWINKGWFFMEIATVAVSLVFLRLYGFEFLTFPLAFTLWFASMDLTPLLFGDTGWESRRLVSVYFGLAMLAVSYVLDLLKKDRDYSFWLYLFGLTAFWCGISFSTTDHLVLKFLYCGMNLLLAAVAVLFRRAVFLVFGALGVFLFLYDLTENVFGDSLLFPICLSVVGVLIVACSVILLRSQGKIDSLLERIPSRLKALIPR